MKRGHKIALGLGALAATASLLAMQPASRAPAPAAASNLKLAAIVPAARRDVDYARLDQRLQALVEKPGMVGLAVGVVENGRITFLKGYGETHAGSGEKVTEETVFRWASVSKGVGATMVAKLAEEGKIDLDAPIANYAPGLKLPGHYEYKASVGDLLSHRVGLYRNAYDNKLEEGIDPRVLRANLVALNPICPSSGPSVSGSHPTSRMRLSVPPIALTIPKTFKGFMPCGSTIALCASRLSSSLKSGSMV